MCMQFVLRFMVGEEGVGNLNYLIQAIIIITGDM